MQRQTGNFGAKARSPGPLEFRGSDSLDPPKRSTRLAGYPISARRSAMVICEVSTDALRLLAEMPDATSEGVGGGFKIYKDTILIITSSKFDNGDMRPWITDRDLEPRSD